MIETFYGLARLGHTDRKGMPNPLQLALSALGFSDIIVFRSPPLAVQRAIFGALALIARWRGYRATYPQPDLGRDWAIFNFEGLRPSCLKMRRMGALILQVAW